jgi:hypothetical protein
MKKLVYSILAAAAVLSAASCQRETQMAREQGGLVDVTFQVGLQGLQTKAFSDGASATTLDVYVYSARTDGDVLLPNLTQQKENAFQNLTAQVTMKLVRGENYKIVFWAHAPQSPYTVDPDKATITVSDAGATPAPAANDELRDAFLGKFEGAVTTAVSASVELTRPFAQLNVLTTDADWDAAIANGITFAGSSMKLTAPSEMNLLTGKVSKEVAMEFAMAPITEAVNIPQYETGYKWIAMNYILAADTKTLIGEANKPFTFAVYREGQADLLFEQNLATIPVQRNYRTIIVGDVFCVDGSFTVSIVPDYDGVLTPGDKAVDTVINADDVTVEVGKTVAIGATTNSTGTMTYKTLDTDMISVDDNGVVTGLKIGMAEVTIKVAAVEGKFKAAEKTITVQVNEPPIATITIDGNLDDWANVTNVFSTGKSRIVEWKYDSDDSNVYFLYKVAKAQIPFNNGYDWEPYIYIGFDTDNDATTGFPGGASLGNGLEAQADCYPWTGSTEGSPEVLAAGENTKGIGIECPVGTSVGWVVAGGKVDGDYSYIEVSVPLAKIGNPTGQITVNHSLSWQTTGSQQITLAGSTTNTPVEPITIDGNMYDWDSFTLMNGTTTSRIRSWKFTSSNDNLYFFFVLRENKMRTAYNLILGFDFDDTGAYTDNNNMKNCEILLSMQPFTNVDAGTPVCVNGDVSTATVNGVSVTGIKAYGYDPDPAATGDSADYHLEISVPKSVLTGLPASGDVNVAGSYEYYWTGFQVLAL